MNKFKSILLVAIGLVSLWSCSDNHLVDTNMAIDDNNWAYAKSVRAAFDVKDVKKPYRVSFKLRHTNAYRYANLYVLMKLKGQGFNKQTRYRFKLAKSDGEWLGRGSGDIYTHSFRLLSDFEFPTTGRYEIEVEQNMRDNPLIGVSDVGITVAPQTLP